MTPSVLESQIHDSDSAWRFRKITGFMTPNWPQLPQIRHTLHKRHTAVVTLPPALGLTSAVSALRHPLPMGQTSTTLTSLLMRAIVPAPIDSCRWRAPTGELVQRLECTGHAHVDLLLVGGWALLPEIAWHVRRQADGLGRLLERGQQARRLQRGLLRLALALRHV